MQQPDSAAPAGADAPDTEELYNLCHEAEKILEQIATGLGQVGASSDAVHAFTQMAEVARRTCAGLAKGMKEQPAEPAHTPPHTMASATDAMMADMHARRAQQ